jgi:hypothetical protein
MRDDQDSVAAEVRKGCDGRGSAECFIERAMIRHGARQREVLDNNELGRKPKAVRSERRQLPRECRKRSASEPVRKCRM